MRYKIYDCFIFNDELDLLELRLSFLDKVVDYFVICESSRTLSGNIKPLYYEINKNRFKHFAHKIIHLVAPYENTNSAWDYEYFQRNYLKQGMISCKDDDIVIISDADEIPDLNSILQVWDKQPALIEIPLYYYFLNLKSQIKYRVNLITKYSFIKHKYIGERNATYPTWTQNIITCNKINTGWHFSYLFGSDIEKYQNKIKAFSHQEYNTDYYLNHQRIKNRITWGIDLLDRKEFLYRFTSIVNNDLYSIAKRIGLSNKTHKSLFFEYFSIEGFKVFINWELKPRLDRLVYLIKYYYKRIPEKLFKK